ncbi:hypothetical protein [Acetomicrobium sp.]|uniref:hypothetical protein n=1 Tax=Acetomicrobium sp. TaxID=1872099 RepID=UPI002FCAD515
MSPCLFSTYSQSENRVTSTFLAVLSSLSLNLMQQIIGAMIGDEVELISFTNQPAIKRQQYHSVPDAMISGDFKILIETKLQQNAVEEDHIRRHQEHLRNRKNAYLVILTPDPTCPRVVENISRKDPRVVWCSFNQINNIINDLFENGSEVISEKDAFLLKNFQMLLDLENLLSQPEVLIVPARFAWSHYLNTSSYICQPNRSFKKTKYIAFYNEGKIMKKVPKILKTVNEVVFGEKGNFEVLSGDWSQSDEKEFSVKMKEVVKESIDSSLYKAGESHKVLLLTGPEEEGTITINNEIPNDSVDKNGAPTAFVQRQRYTPLEKLMRAEKTSDL